jgi:hypothetical protein
MELRNASKHDSIRAFVRFCGNGVTLRLEGCPATVAASIAEMARAACHDLLDAEVMVGCKISHSVTRCAECRHPIVSEGAIRAGLRCELCIERRVTMALPCPPMPQPEGEDDRLEEARDLREAIRWTDFGGAA